MAIPTRWNGELGQEGVGGSSPFEFGVRDCSGSQQEADELRHVQAFGTLVTAWVDANLELIQRS